MKFLADESIDRPIVEKLRQEGYKVWYVAEMEPGISDDMVLDIANRESALLLTADKDFGELVFRLHRLMSGIILIRLAGLSPQLKAEIVAKMINKHLGELPNAFVVISPATFRIRKNGRQIDR